MCPVSVGTSRSTRALQAGEAKLWVLLVGVNQYTDERLPNLSYSALDCQGLGEAIASATQTFPEKTILLHHDFAAASGVVSEIQGLPKAIATLQKRSMEAIARLRFQPAQPPTLAAVRANLKQLVSEARSQDTVLFYFSGHGVLEPEQERAFLCLSDTQKADLGQTGLALEELLNLLGDCAAHQQLVWLDACHSGGLSFRIGKGEEPEALPNPTPQLMALLRQRAAQSKGFYALLSCDRNQQSWEFPKLGHGVFTYYLMRGLLGEAADSQGVIEADALYKYVYYQTLQYIDKTNQQLRLINQQKRGRGDDRLQPEYPLQTPKRIVEGVGELILGLKPRQTEPIHGRRSLVVDGLGNSPASLSLSKTLQTVGNFELTYFPQAGKDWTALREAIQTRLHSRSGDQSPLPDTVLLYLRGRIEESEAGEALLVFREEVRISRSWLRQELRRSPISQQIVVLDCPGATRLTLGEWIEDLQIDPNRGQCLIAAAPPSESPEAFIQALLETLEAIDPQMGLSAAGWIAQLQSVLALQGIQPQVWLSGSQGVIEIVPTQAGRGEEQSPTFDLGLCPYLGLRAFGEDDAPFFFGRESLTLQLLNHLSQHSVLAVVGASGSGKSSVVQAGMLPQLRQGKQIPGSDRWWIRALRPGDRPLLTLASRLVDGGTEKERTYQQLQLEGMLYQGVESFVYWLRSRPEPMLVLVIDQFEELFTLAAAEDRHRFLALILGAVEHAGDRFKLIFTLRTDFIAPALEIPALAPHLQQSSVLVPPTLSDEAYRQVILQPAEKVGLTVEPELVTTLLQDLSRGAGDLPLLEFVLEQVWQQRQPGTLSISVYQEKIGGLRGALERTAQEVYNSLDPEAQACAEWIFLSLTQLGDGTEDTRRRILKTDLVVPRFPEPLVDRTLQVLTSAKLILISLDTPTPAPESRSPEEPPSPDSSSSPLPPTPTIEVAHEILIRHWSTLRWWLEQNRTRLRSQRQIQHAAQQWEQHGRQPDFLLRGVLLNAAEELYVHYTDELSQQVQMFIEAGLEARQREQRQLRRRLRRAQVAIALIGSLGVLASGIGGFAYYQRQQAQLNEIRALNALSESQLLAHHQLEALTTATRANHLIRELPRFGFSTQDFAEVRWQAIATLEQAVEQTQEANRLEGHRQRVSDAHFSPDGQWIASVSDDGTVRLWTAGGELEREMAGTVPFTALAFSPDGATLATTDIDGTVALWEVATGRVVRSLSVGDWATDVAWSNQGDLLAVASRDQRVTLWNLATGEQVRSLTGHSGWVNTVAFSPNGRTLATGGEDQTVRLWDVTTGNPIRSFAAAGDRITDVAFSPDGATLAAASGDRQIYLWQLADGSLQTLTGQTDAVTALQFSPDGKLLISASADHTLRLWRVADTQPLATFNGHGAAVLSASFSPDGRQILSSSDDKTVRLWTAPPLSMLPASAIAVQFNPSNQTFAAAGWDGPIQLWELREGATPFPQGIIAGHTDPVNALAYSPNGELLASGSDDATIQLWNPNTSGLLRSLIGHQAKVTSLSFSPDGAVLASGSEDATVRLWNPTDGTIQQTLSGHTAGVTSVVFSPNGELIASGSLDRTVRLWNADGSLVRTLEAPGLAIATVTFSPDGRFLAAASWDNLIYLWRVNDGTLLHLLSGHQAGVTSLIFSPDGRLLVSGSADRTIKLWNPLDGTLIKTLLGQPDPIRSLSFNSRGDILISASDSLGALQWNLNPSRLPQLGCDRLHNYLDTNPNLEESDRSLCDS